MPTLAQTNAPSTASAVTNGLRDIKPPIEIPSGWEWLWWTLGTLCIVAILLGLLLFLIARRRKVAIPPPRSGACPSPSAAGAGPQALEPAQAVCDSSL